MWIKKLVGVRCPLPACAVSRADSEKYARLVKELNIGAN
jgi:hypothetical protein